MQKETLASFHCKCSLLFCGRQKTEAWESEKTLADMEKYFWDMNISKTRILHLLKNRIEVMHLLVKFAAVCFSL